MNFAIPAPPLAKTILLVMLLAGCTTSPKAPVNYAELGEVVKPLVGAQGKTAEDQNKIDLVMAASCGTKIINTSSCRTHTGKSHERLNELKQPDGPGYQRSGYPAGS